MNSVPEWVQAGAVFGIASWAALFIHLAGHLFKDHQEP